MSSSRALDALKVLQGAAKVAAKVAEVNIPSLEKISKISNHGRDFSANLSRALCSNLKTGHDSYKPEDEKLKLNFDDEQLKLKTHSSKDFQSNTISNELKKAGSPHVDLAKSLPLASEVSHPSLDSLVQSVDPVPDKLATYRNPKNDNLVDETEASDPINNLIIEKPIVSSESKALPLIAVGEKNGKQSPVSYSISTTTEESMKDNSSPLIKNNTTRKARTRRVLSSPLARVLGFGQLAVGLAMGSVAEALRQGVSSKPSVKQLITSDANAERLAEALCRMRGAALKLGQMLSIQDEGMIPPQLAKALERVRAGADTMPPKQLYTQLSNALGSDWRDKIVEFDEKPIAAASIGQVHKAKLLDGSEVAVKIQYPGVADSIESDLSNLERLVTMTNLLPPGLFVEELVEVAREELKLECDYRLEAQNQERFRNLVAFDKNLGSSIYIPAVHHHVTTSQVLTTEMVKGVHIDRVAEMSQEVRNSVARLLLKVTINELFVWRFMQTDPNWGNYLYDPPSQTLNLIDFGSCREYNKNFVDSYLELVWAAANGDKKNLKKISRELEFLTGDENEIMLSAHIEAGMVVGEPFAKNEPFDFAGSNLTSRINKHGQVFAQYRLTPPPREAYSLHRKLAGAFLSCIKLKANITCRDILEETYEKYKSA